MSSIKFRNFLLTLFFLLFSASAIAVEPTLEIKLNETGKSVDLCPSNGVRCTTLVMPSDIGSVKKVIIGNFIQNSPVSWLAVSENLTSLCTVKAFTPEVICAVVSSKLANADISFAPIKKYEKTVWAIKSKLQDSEKNKKAAANFVISVARAQTYLATAIVSPSNSMLRTILGGKRPAAALSTFRADEDEAELPSDPGGSGEGGDFSGPTVVILPLTPPIIVPSLPPAPSTPIKDPEDLTVVIGPPPSLGPAPTEPWYCTYLGVFCSTLAEPAPAQPTTPPVTPVKPAEPAQPGRSNEECVAVEKSCTETCNATPNDQLPGSGTDWLGRWRRCVRECVVAENCWNW